MTNPDLPVLSYGTAPAPSRRGKGFLAICGTVLFPGIGHWIVGSNRRGMYFFLAAILNNLLVIATLLVPRLLPLLFFVLPAGVVLAVLAYIDAYLAGRRSNRTLFQWPIVRYLIGIGLLVLAHFNLNAAGEYIKDHWVEAFYLPSKSMLPTLQPGDRILVSKMLAPARWDIVVFYPPPQRGRAPWVDRVVGLPGETIEIDSKGLRINGMRMSPPENVGPYIPYAVTASGIQFSGLLVACQGEPIRLANDEFFILGDNSQIAADSRFWKVPISGHQSGALPADHIIGVATAIYWPPTRWRELAK
jgi:signal peptidase I